MKTTNKTALTSVLAAAALLLSSCDDQQKAAPTTEPTATAPQPAAAPAPEPTPAPEPAPAPGPPRYDVECNFEGSSIYNVTLIKFVRTQMPEIGVREGKKLVKSGPFIIKENLLKEDADALTKSLEELEASVKLIERK